ncbi:acriflavin resistance protein [Afipia carboxidovorans OM5]|uniref:Multidrug resistance protein MdtC n=1 Tax=Afipia carboxidovorans (strain ATCC 49405 / DSM 1227 / KCTC 32145 / OM5) TaxID=504832 RepID=B6JG47_AFIC5|nr:efflux RND transporter permease subunit [Afipia carboxidovorans]ACI93436.1 acriflavin resistance protein [Afipia carboxidovorans OM5]AEI02852.1 multidrug resistance protein MdtC [Afipia carboxidovorans OM4]AEI06428.1 multidrug resistance protein MdtC [Afipia carboxidovorans OM5]
MNRLVSIALQRPYTFVVLALLLMIVGPLAALRTPTDIFPDIRIPVIGVVWNYTGLPPDQMAGRIVTPFQRALTTTVNDIEHISANSYGGIGIIKIFFQPNVDIRTANAQVTAIAQTMLKQLPPGATPPLILNYSASTVPILQLALSGDGLTEQNLADFATNQLRTPLVTVPGAAIPWPYGGKLRQIQIDLNATALQALGLSGQDVANALAAQNLITPVGNQKIGSFEYIIQVNNSPLKIEELGDLPIRTVNGAMVYIRDVAQVRDGNPPQTNIVHVDGNRSVLMMVLKAGSTSTLDIIDGIKKKIVDVKDTLPETLKIGLIGDQSIFVRGAIEGVAKEGILAALLTSVMILLFLGSWRSTIIIAVSIPLSVFGSVAMLSLIGETLNIMTLGGLALAVGILVDDATVTIENINWHLEHGKEVEPAILDGAAQIVTPAFVSLLCICIVFVPMFFLTGVSRFLFVPMAEAVMFAMIWSFILSRTLVPTMAKYMLHPHPRDENGNPIPPAPSRNPLVKFQRAFEAQFARFRNGYRDLLQLALNHRAIFVCGFLGFVAASFLLVPFLGRNFFPSVDSGQILMHVRTQVGTRVEETANQLADIQKAIREIIPAAELETMTDNIGIPYSGINMTYNNTGVIGTQDGDIQIKLREGHQPSDVYVKALREQLPRAFPGVSFAFLPADIVSQILNFGSPAPIDLQIRGANIQANYAYANDLLRRLRRIPGVADARIQQSPNAPGFNVDVDRTRAQYLGVTERDVVNSLVVNLAGSSQVAPTFFLNPANGVSYSVVMQTPQYQMDSLGKLQTVQINAAGAPNLPLLGGIAEIKRMATNAVVSQHDIQPMVQIFATPQDRDLGAVAADIRKVLDETAKDVPRGSTVVLSGQVETMNSAFSGLLFGLIGAIVLIYLLIVVNFQSWTDPFVIIMALPAALAGIIWMLFVTGTTLSVPALTGAIMCMGVATANSVLVIAFAREELDRSGDPVKAALEAGFVRCRPVLMTALAMIIGMAPMALGLGEGGEQNAPLGRAVVGGLVFATAATLMLVPVVFSMLHHKRYMKPGPAFPEMSHAV